MPDNHRRLLDASLIARLGLMYDFNYIPEENIIRCYFPNSKKVIDRPADKSFQIFVQKFGKKIIFNLEAINFWKDFQSDSNYSKYSLFEVNNAVSFLKMTYQEISREKITNILKNGIKKL